MLNKNKKVKVGFISVLIVLVVVCVVILSKNNGKSLFKKQTNAKILSTWDIDMTPREKNIASWNSYVKKDDMMYIYDDGMIFEWDYKSVEFRPACSDPACDHHEDNCSASFPVTRYEYVTYCNDHWVFVEKDSSNRYYLGYSDFDGNNRKKVLDITDDIQGIVPWLYIECIEGKIYLYYNSSVTILGDSDYDSVDRLCIMRYDVSHIDSDKSYAKEVFSCDGENYSVIHLLSIDGERFAIDVPETGDGFEKNCDSRIYNQTDMSYITVKGAEDVTLLSKGRYITKEKEGLMLVDGERKIRLDEEGWGVPFYDENRIYTINTVYRQMKSRDENSVIPDAEVRVRDYEGNLLEQIYLPKDFSLIDGIAAYDGRYYMTSIDCITHQYFYVYDTQNPDKGWKKINRGH
ncbi:MAG TPA: hypothetical protein DCX21_03855 [Eubacterium sp.]|nr:hypothetical protein [Eubacterium sp.]